MEHLHKQFVRLASQRNKITHELLALIPELEKQRIWEKQGYQDVCHYAKAIAGLSANVIRKRLRLEKHISDKPHLLEAVKTQGVHKVAMVATLATTENEKHLADFVTNASKSAVQEYAKELRQNGENRKCHAQQKISIDLDDEMQRMFLKLKQKYGDKISNKEALRRILKEAAPQPQSPGRSTTAPQPQIPGRSTIAPQPQCHAKAAPQPQHTGHAKAAPQSSCHAKSESTTQGPGHGNLANRDEKVSPGKLLPPGGVLAKSRYVTKEKQNSLEDFCIYPGCNRPKEALHHRDRFASSQSHDSVQPFCDIHHEFAHNGKISNELEDPEEWFLGSFDLKEEDLQYRKYRRAALLF